GAFAAVTMVWLLPLVVAMRGQITLLASFVGAVNQAGLSSPAEPSIAIPLLCLVGGLWLVRRHDVDPRLRWYLLAGAALFGTPFPRLDTPHLAWWARLLLVVVPVALDRMRPLAVSLAIVLGAFVLSVSISSSRLDL